MLELIHKAVWGPWLMVLFLGVGTLYTVRSGFFQLRGLKVWWQATAGSFGKTGKEQVKTACTALAATVGTGNITGVATAVAAGGPGALFWMWVSAAAGMMTAYGEVYLGIQSRYEMPEGGMACGPYVYLEQLAGQKGLAFVYAGLCVLGSLGMGSMVQANALAETASYSFGIPAAAATATPTAAPSPTAGSDWPTQLDRNSDAAAIQTVQMKLYQLGLLSTDGVEVGVLDTATLQAIAGFQTYMNETYDMNLPVIDPSNPDSVIDAQTLSQLQQQNDPIR